MTENRNNDTGIKRRDLLKTLWGVSLLALFGQSGIALADFFKPRIKSGNFGSRVIAGQVEEFTPGTVSHISSGRFFLSRLEDRSMIALWQRCTHLGCTIAWREQQGIFHCPCHSSEYNTVGEVIGGPAPRPLDYFPISIENDQVIVDTGKPTQRESYDPSQTVET